MNQKQTHWYPGHMHKAIQSIHEKIAWIDLLVVVVDARAIDPSRLLPLQTKKPILYVLTKDDLADPTATKQSVETLRKAGHSWVVSLGKTPKSRLGILQGLKQMGEPLWLKQEKKGVKRQPLKVMVTGVPNVGKSTLINLLAKHQRVATENRPGSTRGQQWIKLDDDLVMLDTPGILPPRFDQQESSIQLALIGAMPLQQLPLDLLAHYLYQTLMKRYPQAFQALHVNIPFEAAAFFNMLGRKRGWIKQDQVDLERVYFDFIKAFQDGKLGRFSLPSPTHELNT